MTKVNTPEATIHLHDPAIAAARFWAKVDKSGDCWLWTGYVDKDGYGRFRIGTKIYGTHRLAFEWDNGPIPVGMVIDHACHTPQCVKSQHLRLATRKQNSENRRGAQSNNRTSGVRGVSLHRPTGRWQAQLKHHGKIQHLGNYSSIAEAQAVVSAKRAELFTHSQD